MRTGFPPKAGGLSYWNEIVMVHFCFFPFFIFHAGPALINRMISSSCAGEMDFIILKDDNSPVKLTSNEIISSPFNKESAVRIFLFEFIYSLNAFHPFIGSTFLFGTIFPDEEVFSL